ncbi:MAG: ABC transporter permease [Erysipelotrichaceae bacterium]|nr:ABC transporter permease [Erysipelotrichaceae bacterium]
MHNTSKVFKFELQSIFNRKSVRVVTVIMVIVFFAATCIPTVLTFFEDKTPDDTENPIVDLERSGIVLMGEDLTKAELVVFIGDKVEFYTDESTLRKAVEEGKIDSGFVISSVTSFKTILKNKDMMNFTSDMVSYILTTIKTERNLVLAGIDPVKVKEASNVKIVSTEEILGKDANQSFLISYILMFAVYMLVIMYGSFVSTSVAREKDNRTMEILITSTKPDALIVGKVLANGVAGLVQFTLIFSVALIGYFLNQASFPEVINQMLFGSLTWDAILVFLMFTSLGYLLYLFVYASLGSLVSKLEDVSSSVSVVTLLFMVAYLMANLGLNMPNSLIIKIASYFPFTAILSMPIRYFMTQVSIIELLISLAIMAITTWSLAIFSIRIYRFGSLSYGNKMSLIKAMKAIFSKA